MIAIVQRVTHASVLVNDSLQSSIGHGLVVYLGVHEDDSEKDEIYIARKIANLRIFADEQGQMNNSVIDTAGGILLISQFTLCANTRKGNRPSFNSAMSPDRANTMYREIADLLVRTYKIPVETGVFGAHMLIDYINDGPVTIILDSKKQFKSHH